MTTINRATFAAIAGAAMLCASAGAGSAQQKLVAGDEPATVYIGLHGRPLTGATSHVVAFERGGVLYVGLEELTRVVTGTITKAGSTVTVTSFRGAPDSKTATFKYGSKVATVGATSVTMEAPTIEAYGYRPYIPLSFLNTGVVRTKVKESADHRTGTIILPPDLGG